MAHQDNHMPHYSMARHQHTFHHQAQDYHRMAHQQDYHMAHQQDTNHHSSRTPTTTTWPTSRTPTAIWTSRRPTTTTWPTSRISFHMATTSWCTASRSSTWPTTILWPTTRLRRQGWRQVQQQRQRWCCLERQRQRQCWQRQKQKQGPRHQSLQHPDLPHQNLQDHLAHQILLRQNLQDHHLAHQILPHQNLQDHQLPHQLLPRQNLQLPHQILLHQNLQDHHLAHQILPHQNPRTTSCHTSSCRTKTSSCHTRSFHTKTSRTTSCHTSSCRTKTSRTTSGLPHQLLQHQNLLLHLNLQQRLHQRPCQRRSQQELLEQRQKQQRIRQRRLKRQRRQRRPRTDVKPHPLHVLSIMLHLVPCYSCYVDFVEIGGAWEKTATTIATASRKSTQGWFSLHVVRVCHLQGVHMQWLANAGVSGGGCQTQVNFSAIFCTTKSADFKFKRIYWHPVPDVPWKLLGLHHLSIPQFCHLHLENCSCKHLWPSKATTPPATDVPLPVAQHANMLCMLRALT